MVKRDLELVTRRGNGGVAFSHSLLMSRMARHGCRGKGG
jgi:hypothetical protein